MILVDAQLPDAADDFALELYFMRMKNPPEMMFLWRNPPTLMLGRNQELQQEIAVEEAERNNILIRRRYSGGGTIYTDFGTVQVTHLIPNAPNPSECLEFEGRNLARALNQLNVPAVFAGRNDLMLAGRKICGNAGYGMNGHYLYHGSVLIRTDLDLIDRLLTVTPDKLLKHGIRSVRQRVTNIADHCTVDDPGEFVKQLQQVIAPAKAETWSPDETVLKGLDRIKADFFGNGGWIADPQTAGTGTYPPGN